MTHEERAKQLKWRRCPHDLNTGSLSASTCDTCLAEQFREVERQADDSGFQRGRSDKLSDVDSIIRAIVRAGDALREVIENPEVIAVWDAATKGVERG